MKVLTVFGTRPEAIKMAPVVLELQKHPQAITSRVCVTAQHREMLDQVLDIFGIVPDIDLDVMHPDQKLANLTARILSKVDTVLRNERPDVVLVQGDTTTVMTVALAAFYNKIPVGHVEAGLRTNNRYSPFPEEINRRLAGVLSAYHFAPTDTAKKALLREGVSEEQVFVTGNTVIDALHIIVERPCPALAQQLVSQMKTKARGCSNSKLILVTAHRRENFGGRLEAICLGLRQVVERNPEAIIIYPVHLNPKVREPVYRILGNIERIILTEPVMYNTMAHLMNNAYIILTDSGGIQEEAPALGKPVLVLRTETERPEAIEAGTAKLIGPFSDKIVTETERLLHNSKSYEQMAQAVSPYGDGYASERIVAVLAEKLSSDGHQ